MKIEIIKENELETTLAEQAMNKLCNLYPDASVEGMTLKFNILEKNCKMCGRPFVASNNSRRYCEHHWGRSNKTRCQQMIQYMLVKYGRFDDDSYYHAEFMEQCRKNYKKLSDSEYDDWVLLCYKANFFYTNNILPKKQFEGVIKTKDIKFSAEVVNNARNIYNYNQRSKAKAKK